jgi:NAD(P)-dependent dehydrogenase (short-subunit alcohol dehydrogenase family)
MPAQANSAESLRDPRSHEIHPPFRERDQEPPGLSQEMKTKPDHGEESYVGHDRLKDRHALITGGDSGIGRAVALAFAREGADVLISYLEEEQEDAKDTARLVEGSGRKCVCVPGDIRSPEHCSRLVDQAFSSLGGLDILVNNAAFQSVHESIEEFSLEEWDRTFRTNIYSMFYLCRAGLPRMPVGSSIINTTSVNAYLPKGHLLAYSSTKGAIDTFTRELAQMAVDRGIRVNAIAPGPVWTPLIPSTMPADHVQHFGEDIPMKRPAQPAELAPVFVFLASDDSRFITGSIVDVTGGRMLP